MYAIASIFDRTATCFLFRALVGFAGLLLSSLGGFAAELSAIDRAHLTTTLQPESGRLVVDVHGLPPTAPVFFSAVADQVLRVGPDEIVGEMNLRLRVVQGRPEILTLGLSGAGEVVDVSGKQLRDWSVRRVKGDTGERRLLDLRITPRPAGALAVNPEEIEVIVRTRLRGIALPGTVALLMVTPGDAVGFSSTVTVRPESTIDLRVTSAVGMTPLGESLRFYATGEGRIEVRLTPRGGAKVEAELIGARLEGHVNEAAGSVEFRLSGQLRAQKAGARLRLLTGQAALTGLAAGYGWAVELVSADGKTFAYDLVAGREGTLPVELMFSALVREQGDWRAVEFVMPAGAVVPLQLDGLAAGVSFKPDAPIAPVRVPIGAGSETGWQGFLPADGTAALAWRRTREAGDSALAFTSVEQTEVRVGAGLLRQSSQVAFRVLQGKLAGVRFRLDGPGEILGVEGPDVVGWKVLPGDAGARILEVKFSRPAEADAARILIRSQSEIGNSAVRAEPVRLTPEGGVRHSGIVRVANTGAVRLEVADLAGMMQLAPDQFPGPAPEAGARQVFVYRFPSSNYGYRVLATQIQAEIAVSMIATWELGETVRVIDASLELEVREAAVREWTLRIPADYTVVALTGNDVADHAVESDATGGTRALRVLFGRAIEGRQLLQLRLEKNQPAGAGEWSLPALQFPGAKSVRGHIGAVATPGYRLAPLRTDRLVEVPVSVFPRQTAGLQQSWRVREAGWTADLRIEALGQSVQADVFHLYALKEGVVASSVLINYFVVGAPANEWRIEVPASLGNLDVTGQNVRRDWRREGDQVIVSLHQPVLGAATLLLTFEQPLSVRGGTIHPGQVRPLGVQGERGFIQVVSPLQVKHEIRRAEGALLKLEPTELPAEFRLFTSSPSLAVYHYTARPFLLELGLEWYAPGETVDQVVDFAKLSSQVSREGQVVTEATFFVKSRGRMALRIVLPAGVKLWEARVNRELVNARADGEQTLIPLSAQLQPNEPVVVALRLGQAAPTSGAALQLVAPRVVASTTVVSEWLIQGEAGRVLLPRGGNAELVRPVLTETGFEWILDHAVAATGAVLALAYLSVLLRRGRSAWTLAGGALACVAAIAGAVLLAGEAMVQRRPTLTELTFATTLVPANEAVTVAVENVPEWRAMITPWGLVAIVVGAALLIGGVRLGARGAWARIALQLVGVTALTAGILAQRGGAVMFFLVVALTLLAAILVPLFGAWRKTRRVDSAEIVPPPGAGGATVASMIVLLGLLAVGTVTPDAAAQTKTGPVTPPTAEIERMKDALPDGTRPVQAMIQAWSIRGDRLSADVDVTLTGRPGDSFLLLRPPAVLTEFKGDGLRVAKVERDGTTAYYMAPEREGRFTAHAHFELAVPDRTRALVLPTGPAVVQRVIIDLDEGGWEFVSPMAVQVMPGAENAVNHSSATLVLAPHAAPTIQLRPRGRDLGAETTQFFAEASNLFVPGPGVVNGFTRVLVRPVQGRVSAIEIAVPPGLTVGDVSRGPVGAWRFDPTSRRLHVAIEPAQSGVFQFDVETQVGAGELPFALALEPLRVPGAAGDVGLLAVAFAGEAQPEGVRVTSLSPVNAQDFDATLLPRGNEGQPLATLHQVWRYGPGGGRVDLKIAPVAPEVRVTSRQILSLDDDRMVLSADLRVVITRVGLFRLSFVLPEGLEIEALSGAALSQWTEALEGTQRIVTLQLNGRTIGEHSFNLALAGPAPRAQAAWPFPRLVVREATRQTGEALVVPGKGLRLRTVEHERVTQLDPRTVGGQQPGTLAFRLLQEDWVLRLGIEALDPWVTVQALQEVTLREGQTLTRLGLRYRVENAAVKQLRVKLPGLSEESARTVRATGPAVSDIVRIGNPATDEWEIRLQRGIAGETEVQIEYQGPAVRDNGQEAIVTPEFAGVRQTTQFVAVRGGGRLELEAAELPRGWVRVDWSTVPAAVQNRGDRSVPALCFRVAEPEGALAIKVRRHEVAEALKLRVTQGDLMTLFAPTGAFLTAVELKVDVLEKSTLRVRLPAGARLFNTLVNGESRPVVREGDAWLFHVAPHTAGERAATVRLVYAVSGDGRGPVGLMGPSLSVPLENVTWRVVIPPGYELDDYTGGLRLRDERDFETFGVEQYQSLVNSKRSTDSQQAMSLLQEANRWMQKGEQEKAGEALSRVSNTNALDQASNEDARVQLRNLKTQQAVVGLNTRRQRLYLDHRGDGARNESLEQAASANPFMQGKVNFNPQQVDQLLLGNSAEENTALKGIATRIVDQQLAAEPAPGAIDVTLPERGRVLTFTRSLQVDGGAPLELKLALEKITRAPFGLSLLLVLGVAGIAAVELVRRGGVRA